MWFVGSFLFRWFFSGLSFSYSRPLQPVAPWPASSSFWLRFRSTPARIFRRPPSPVLTSSFFRLVRAFHPVTRTLCRLRWCVTHGSPRWQRPPARAGYTGCGGSGRRDLPTGSTVAGPPVCQQRAPGTSAPMASGVRSAQAPAAACRRGAGARRRPGTGGPRAVARAGPPPPRAGSRAEPSQQRRGQPARAEHQVINLPRHRLERRHPAHHGGPAA